MARSQQVQAASLRTSSALMSFLQVTPVLLLLVGSAGGLQVGYYDTSCPVAEAIVKVAVAAYHFKDPFYAAGILRMHFHDCWVRGCDASVLLVGPGSEQTAPANNNSLRGFPVIELAKTALEIVCPRTVSCADILAFAARDSVVISGGPYWDVPAGRFDGRVSNATDASILPSPSFNVTQLTSNFASKGFNQTEMVTLSGAHTIGQAHCGTFSKRLYPTLDPTLNASLATKLENECPQFGANPNFRQDLDIVSPLCFDNQYYKNLAELNGLLTSDETLYTDNSTTKTTTEIFANNTLEWQAAFVAAIIKMGNLPNVTVGEIRADRLCKVVNS
jgi:peroxidase